MVFRSVSSRRQLQVKDRPLRVFLVLFCFLFNATCLECLGSFSEKSGAGLRICGQIASHSSRSVAPFLKSLVNFIAGVAYFWT